MARLATHSLFVAFVVMVCFLSEHGILCGKSLQRTTGEGLSYANFVHHPFQYLNATKVKLYLVHEVTACATVCVGNFSCFSFNIAKRSGMNGYFLCELLASDKYNSSDQFLPHSDFDHYSIHTPCSENPCKNGGTCIALYDNDDFKCKCTPGIQGKKCEKVYGSQSNAGKSCKDIKNRTSTTKDGEYWIDPNSRANPFKVFCDMTTDGGGWTLIKRTLLLSDGGDSLKLRYLAVKDYRGISNYTINHQVVTSNVLGRLRQDMGFDQFRFYCFKKAVGRVFHVKTALNELGEAFLHSHTQPRFNKSDLGAQPTACGSFEAFSDDTSILSEKCREWGETGWNDYEKNRWGSYLAFRSNRMYHFLAGIRNEYTFRMHSGETDIYYSCDDHKCSNTTLSKGDVWKVFVR